MTRAFAPGTFAFYAAEVGNAVTTVTLTAMTTDFADGITVPPILAGDNEIAGDAHGGEPGLEPIRL